MLIVIYIKEEGSSSVDEQHQKNQTKTNPNLILLTLDYKTHLPSIFNTHSFMTFCFNDYASNLRV